MRLRAPRMQMLATVRRMPRTRPGKKPTRTAAVGNLAQEATGRAPVFVAEELAELAIVDVLKEKVVDVECAVDEEEGTADVVGALD